MIVVAITDAEKWAMYRFLREHGVMLQRSDDLQMIGRVGGGGDLIGVVAFNGFCGNVCFMHCAGAGNWVSREFIRQSFAYPFVQLKLRSILAPVPANNSKALKFDTHFGFREVHRVTDGWEDGVDLVLLELRREDCKYIGEANETRIAEAA